MKVTEVKPCPVCGSMHLSMWYGFRRFFMYKYNVVCERCFFTGKTARIRKAAIRKWNKDNSRWLNG